MILDMIKKFFLGKLFKKIVKTCLSIVICALIILEIFFAIYYKDTKFADLPDKVKWLLFWKYFL